MQSSGLPKEDRRSKYDTWDQERRSVTILDTLNEMGIPFFINTAAPNPCGAYGSLGNFHNIRGIMRPSVVLVRMGLSSDGREQIPHFGTTINRCGHVLSAEYEKHVPIDYIITQYQLPTTIIIHVDDGLINLKTVLESGFTQDVIGLYFPTVDNTTIGDEPNKEEALSYLYSNDNVEPLEVSGCTSDSPPSTAESEKFTGTISAPFPSKAAADRFQRAMNHRFQKGDVVHYWFKHVYFTHWQW